MLEKNPTTTRPRASRPKRLESPTRRRSGLRPEAAFGRTRLVVGGVGSRRLGAGQSAVVGMSADHSRRGHLEAHRHEVGGHCTRSATYDPTASTGAEAWI